MRLIFYEEEMSVRLYDCYLPSSTEVKDDLQVSYENRFIFPFSKLELDVLSTLCAT